ncbi:MAG: hypothetical protein U0892_12185 [Pirellulales bacterium]
MIRPTLKSQLLSSRHLPWFQRLSVGVLIVMPAMFSSVSGLHAQQSERSSAALGSGGTDPGSTDKAESRNELIQRGVLAFQQRCVDCHDAQRSLKEDKSLEEWRTVVKKMADMKDADIPQAEHEPIAQYLASVGTGGKSKSGKSDSAGTDGKLDAAAVQQGKQQFTQYCISCHDAEKSLQVSKSLTDWKATVERMAGKDGANIPTSTHQSIAAYLASLSSSSDKGGSGAGSSSTSVFGTVSPWFRGSGSNNVELPGFFGDVWVGLAYQNSSPVSLKATACNTCHDPGGEIGKFDLVEAIVKYDLMKSWKTRTGGSCPMSASVQAGRFVVPFGAYYQQVNPGVDRAVTRPLIYNMGQRVYDGELGSQVLPMPYSDEGASFNAAMPLGESLNTTLDAYVVNGLQGDTNGIDFDQTRNYTDNNRTPSVGGRFTVGNKYLRLGSSIIGGRFSSNDGVGQFNQGMNYMIFGLDSVFTYQDVLRIQAEFAQRDSDRFGALPNGPALFRERYSGGYLQSELLLSRRRKISAFFRYDSQWTHSDLPPVGSQLVTGDFRVERLTYGINWTLPGGSLLMTDFENWRVPDPFQNVNVLGVRWAATF